MELELDRNDPLPGKGVFSNQQYSRLSISEVRAGANVIIDGCDIERLDIMACTFESLRVTASRVGRITVKKLRTMDGGLCVVDSSTIGRAEFFDLRGLDLLDIEADGAITVGSPEGNVMFDSVSCDQLIVRDARRRPVSHVSLRDTRVRSGCDVRNLLVGRITISTSSFSDLSFQDLSVTDEEGLELESVTVDGRFELRSSDCGSDGQVVLRNTWIGREAEVTRVSGSRDGVVRIVDSHLLGGLMVGPSQTDTSGNVLRIGNTRVAGRTVVAGLGEGQGPSLALALESGAQIEELVIPSALRVTRRNVEKIASQLFTEVDYRQLQTMRLGLGREGLRPNEEDAAYFAARQHEVAESAFGRIASWVMGQVFGWGVALWPPVRAFLIGVAATALLLVLSDAGARSGPGSRLVSGVVGSLELWTDLGPGRIETLDGSIESVLVLIPAVLGIVLITVIFGIVIRKLVR